MWHHKFVQKKIGQQKVQVLQLFSAYDFDIQVLDTIPSFHKEPK